MRKQDLLNVRYKTIEEVAKFLEDLGRDKMNPELYRDLATETRILKYKAPDFDAE